jgi:hypothetical protein
MQVTVECTWESAGWVQLEGGELAMPELPDQAGVYQWVFRHDGRERRYVGEAANLRQRFESYRVARTDDGTNGRMRQRAGRVLEAGGSVELLLATSVRIAVGGESHPADLSSKHVRCLLENATLVDVLAEVGELANDIGHGTLREDPVLG